jgi:hypothetical protein
MSILPIPLSFFLSGGPTCPLPLQLSFSPKAFLRLRAAGCAPPWPKPNPGTTIVCLCVFSYDFRWVCLKCEICTLVGEVTTYPLTLECWPAKSVTIMACSFFPLICISPRETRTRARTTERLYEELVGCLAQELNPVHHCVLLGCCRISHRTMPLLN